MKPRSLIIISINFCLLFGAYSLYTVKMEVIFWALAQALINLFGHIYYHLKDKDNDGAPYLLSAILLVLIGFGICTAHFKVG